MGTFQAVSCVASFSFNKKLVIFLICFNEHVGKDVCLLLVKMFVCSLSSENSVSIYVNTNKCCYLWAYVAFLFD